MMSKSAQSLRPDAATKRWLLPTALIIGGIVLATLLTAFKPEPDKKAVSTKPMAVNALAVKKQDITLMIPSQGRVIPRVKTVLTSEVSGNVIQVSEDFVNGGFVRKGQLLLKLDDRNYIAAVKRAEADVARFNKLLIQEKGQAQVAYNQWKKSKDVKRTPEALSLLLRKPQLKEAESSLEFARAELERARGDLQKTEVRAPFDGLIKRKYIDYAQYAVAGSNIAELVGIEYAEVRLALPQDRLAYLELPDITAAMTASRESSKPEPDTATDSEAETTPAPSADAELKAVPVTLESDFGDEKHRWQAKIIRTEGLFDEKNYSLFAVAEIEDPYHMNETATAASQQSEPLLIGTYVEAMITGRELQNVVTLPRHVLRAGNQVWTIDDNNQLYSRKLETLRIGGDVVYVTSGLEDGDRICLTHVGEVVPGTPVRIAELSSQ